MRRWGWFWPSLLLGLLGFAGNRIRYELFFNVDFLFGSTFVLLAAFRYGLRGAALAGVTAGSCTYLLWNHPWAILVHAMEALWVAAAIRRKNEKEALLTQDLAYWVFLGAPLIWVTYGGIMGMQGEAVLLTILRQSINGVVNALCATLLILAYQLRPGEIERRDKPGFRQIVFTSMVSLVVFPAIVMVTANIRDHLKDGQDRIVAATAALNDSAAGVLKAWTDAQFRTLAAFSRFVAEPGRKGPDFQSVTNALLEGSQFFSSVDIRDTSGAIRFQAPAPATSTAMDGTAAIAGRTLAEEMGRRRESFISDILPDPTDSSGYIVYFASPIVRQTRYSGFTTSSVRLSELRRILSSLAQQSGKLTVVDSNDQVILSTDESHRPTASYVRPNPAERNYLSDGVSHWVPVAKPGVSNMQRWRESFLIKSQDFDKRSGWTLITEMDVLPVLNSLTTQTVMRLGSLAVLVLFTIVLAAWLSRIMVETLLQLQRATQELPERIHRESNPALPESRISEPAGLIENFRITAVALRSAFSEQKRHLREKEALIKDLHDGIGGIMTNIGMLGRYALTQEKQDASRSTISKIVELASEGSQEIRTFMNSTETGDAAWSDLVAEVKDYASKLFESKSIQFRISAPENPGGESRNPNLGSFRYINTVRIIREALTNCLKHSQAHHVAIELGLTPDHIFVKVHDDGIGFDPAKVRRRGVASMLQRAQNIQGRLTIQGTPGTSVQLEVPL